MKISRSLALLVGTLPLSFVAAPASAQQIVEERTVASGPNRSMLYSGIWTLGLSYVPALVVAAESSRHGDKDLYIPVAGPWMDLANRSACPPNIRCSDETANKVLLVIDGVFQGLGALDIIGAFLMPETRTITTRTNAKTDFRLAGLSLRLSPAWFQSGYGISALGSF